MRVDAWRNYATRGKFLRKGLFHLVEPAEPYIPITASEAKVKQKASARSGEDIPRFLSSSLPSIWILPLEVNEYLTAANSAINASSLGIRQSRCSSHALALCHSSAF